MCMRNERKIDIDLGLIESYWSSLNLLQNDACVENNVQTVKENSRQIVYDGREIDHCSQQSILLFVCLLRSLSMASGEGQNYELKANIYYCMVINSLLAVSCIFVSHLIVSFFCTDRTDPQLTGQLELNVFDVQNVHQSISKIYCFFVKIEKIAIFINTMHWISPLLRN